MDNVTCAADQLPTFKVINNTQLLAYIFAILFPSLFFAFDLLLLTATISNRRDVSIPVAYIVVMCLRGMISNFINALEYLVFLISTIEEHENFLYHVGRETTLLGTFAYLIALIVNVLMSINRIAVVIKPFNEWFTHTRVFMYCSVIAIFLLVFLIVPYLGPCFVVFMVNKQSFVSGCAPGKHPMTNFRDTYAIILPCSCMVLNLSIILHLRFVRNNSYTIFWHKLRRIGFSTMKLARTSTILDVQDGNAGQSSLFSKMRARREVIMIRQTISIAIYLSIYEFGAFIIKIFPEMYTSLSQTGKQTYFYIRLESIPLLNFFIYFVETKKTRNMVCRFLRSRNKQDSNLDTVSHRTAHRNVAVV